MTRFFLLATTIQMVRDGLVRFVCENSEQMHCKSSCYLYNCLFLIE